MNYLKKLGKALLYIIGTFLILTFLVTLLNYINLIGRNTVNIFKIIIPIVSLFIGGFSIGKNSIKKGWLEGIKLGIIFIIILIIFNYLGLNNVPKLKNILFYLIIISSSIFGSMIGISKNNIQK